MIVNFEAHELWLRTADPIHKVPSTDFGSENRLPSFDNLTDGGPLQAGSQWISSVPEPGPPSVAGPDYSCSGAAIGFYAVNTRSVRTVD